MIITIDGPAASGKTSVARALAQKLSWYYILSGYLYRAMTYGLVKLYGDVDFNDIVVAEEHVIFLLNLIEYRCVIDDGVKVLYDGCDITVRLKDPLIDRNVSLVSKQGVVREHIVKLQRDLASNRDVIVEGRDCGTIVFPDAACKIFLTADPLVRALRWQNDHIRQGLSISLDECLRFIGERDHRDETREISPLKISSDACVIDTSHDSFEEVIKKIIDMLQARGIISQR